MDTDFSQCLPSQAFWAKSGEPVTLRNLKLHLVQKENVRERAQLGENICSVSYPSQEVFRLSSDSLPLNLLSCFSVFSNSSAFLDWIISILFLFVNSLYLFKVA